MLISVTTLLWLAYISLSWISTVGGALSSGTKIPYKYFYVWMPITFTIASIYEVRKYIQKLMGTYVKTQDLIIEETMKEGVDQWK
jgi:TRAP-type C4-dicarboxylate transport system permease small subunit